MNSELLSAGQAASCLGISRSTLDRAVRGGTIPVAQMTARGHRRFRLADLDQHRLTSAAQRVRRWKGAHAPEQQAVVLRGAQYYRWIVETAHEGVVQTDADGTVVFVNRRMAEILGRSPDELIGTPVSSYYADGLQRSHALADRLERIRSGGESRYEALLLRPDGSTVWASVTAVTIQDQHGRFAGTLGMAADITAQKDAEEALLLSEQRYRQIVETSGEGIWQIDASLKTVLVNRKLLEITGYTESEMFSASVYSFFEGPDRAMVAADIHRLLQGIGSQFETRIRCRDGTFLWVNISSSPALGENGRFAGAQALVTDISKRKQQEQAQEQARQIDAELNALQQRQAKEDLVMAAVGSALASALEPSELYQVILDQAARVLPCDHASVLLYEQGWAVVAASWGQFAQPSGLRVFRVQDIAPIMAYGKDGTPALVSDTRQIHWLDTPPFVGNLAIRSVISVPLVVGRSVVGTFNVDSFTPGFYTEQHLTLATALAERVQQALRNARLFAAEQARASAAEAFARLQEGFVASVSHELRTPLTAIVGYGELLNARWDQFTDLERRQRIGRVVASAHRLQRLVADLLLVNQLETEVLAPRCVSASLAPLVQLAADEVEGSYSGQVINLRGAPDVCVLADPDRTVQILANLIDNAAKYSPEGCPVTVRWQVEGPAVAVRVCDEGPGIRPEGHDQLFTRFGRVPGSRMRSGHVGTGLGLYVGRLLARAMAGELDLETSGAGGSTFCLRLPSARA